MGDFMEEIFNGLTKLIKQNDNFIIMTHKNPDFDGMGSAIALQQIIKSFKKESYILVNNKELDKSMRKAFKLLDDRNIEYKTISKMEVNKIINEESVVIILDTCKSEIVEYPKLLETSKNIV